MDKLLVALDVETGRRALDLAATLRDLAGGVKVGSRLFTLEGPSLVRALAEANATRVEKAIGLVSGLPSLARCDDVEALAGALPPPEDPQVAAQARSLREQVHRIDRTLRDGEEVTLGGTANGQRIVTSGLKPGERIVVNGLQRVRPGALLAPQPTQPS